MEIGILNSMWDLSGNVNGYDNDNIKLLWDLYDIKDFRETAPIHNNTATSTYSSSGCMILTFAILNQQLCVFVE